MPSIPTATPQALGVCGSVQAAKEYDTHLQAGANIAGFLKVADAMLAHGVF